MTPEHEKLRVMMAVVFFGGTLCAVLYIIFSYHESIVQCRTKNLNAKAAGSFSTTAK